MSIVSHVNSSNVTQDDEVMIIDEKPPPKKVLEEDEYLGRMASIIKRDFFSKQYNPEGSPSCYMTETTNSRYTSTPQTSRTQL